MAEEEKKETAPEVQDDFGVYKAWLRNTHLTEQLQGEIARGIKAATVCAGLSAGSHERDERQTVDDAGRFRLLARDGSGIRWVCGK